MHYPTNRPSPANFLSKLATRPCKSEIAPFTAAGSVLPKYWAIASLTISASLRPAARAIALRALLPVLGNPRPDHR